jgi:hypothetical protein
VPIDKATLGVAGEFAVAAELCRRNMYAQLTLGHQKRTDLLLVNDSRMFRIEVKAKQCREWPSCRGISAPGSFLVFVDFAGKSDVERPDFYVLTVKEWRGFVVAAKKRYEALGCRVEITKDNVLRSLDEVNKYGQAYEGTGVKPEDIQQHREKWQKFSSVMKK